MARVKVLAVRLGSDRAPVGRIAYTAQVYVDDYATDPLWLCSHDHNTPVEAQTCGVQYLTDRLVGRHEAEAPNLPTP